MPLNRIAFEALFFSFLGLMEMCNLHRVLKEEICSIYRMFQYLIALKLNVFNINISQRTK